MDPGSAWLPLGWGALLVEGGRGHVPRGHIQSLCPSDWSVDGVLGGGDPRAGWGCSAGRLDPGGGQ